MDIEVSVVTPMHNEELCIEEFHRRISTTLTGAGYSHEIILVNDGSTDRTPRLMRELSEGDPNLVGVNLSRNRGQCTAIYAGIQQSRGRYVVIMDGDLQHKPEEVPSLVEAMKKDGGYDLVSGMRQKRSESKWLRLVPSRVANWMIRKASKCEVHDMGGLSCLDGELARSLHLREGHHRIIPALVYRMGGRVTEVPTSAPPRFAGSSHYGIGRSVDVLFDIVTLWFQNSFKQRPVYLFGRIALALFLAASLLMAWVLFEKVFFGEHTGNRPPFFGAILFYLASLGFMSTGFILEALGDTMDSVMNTRPYVVRDILKNGRTERPNGNGEN
jgi:glycosyltransferase involved in cell wall biosynthesis